MLTDLPLDGRAALVTGVSRRRGIGFAVARRLAEMGASLAVHHHLAHDLAEYGSTDDIETLVEDLRETGPGRVIALAGDLAEPSASEDLVAEAHDFLGHLDILICNHAHGGDAVSIRDASAEAYDRHWAVNARATLLLTQAFAAQHDGRPGGRAIWMTSGQQLGPMSDNLAYAVSKAALAGATTSVAADLATSRILLNTVNPGPVNTGYLDNAPRNCSSTSPQGGQESPTTQPGSSPGSSPTQAPGSLARYSTPRAASNGEEPWTAPGSDVDWRRRRSVTTVSRLAKFVPVVHLRTVRARGPRMPGWRGLA